MDRTLFRATFLAVAALLVIACSNASADPGTPAPEGSITPSEQSAQLDVPPSPLVDGAAADDAGPEATDQLTPTSSQDVPSSEPVSQDAPSQEAPSQGTPSQEAPSQAGAADERVSQGPEQTAVPPPGGDAPAEAPASDPATPSDPAPPSGAAVFVAGESQEVSQPRTPTQPPAGPTDGVPSEPDQPVTTSFVPIQSPTALTVEHRGGARAPQSRADEGGAGVEQRLGEVERQLGAVQTQMDDMRRGLDDGQVPSTDRLVELRSRLQRIAPVLLALDKRLAAAANLSPRLRALLRHIRSHLAGTRVSAASLIAALRRSGARGPEVRLLLRELEGFRALHMALVPGVDMDPAGLPPLTDGVQPAHPQGGTGSLASTPPPAAAPQDRPAAEHSATEAPVRGGADPSAPTPSTGGSATASAAGAFSAAGAALAAALLIALALPRLRARLELPPSRRYFVAVLAPLERPG